MYSNFLTHRDSKIATTKTRSLLVEFYTITSLFHYLRHCLSLAHGSHLPLKAYGHVSCRTIVDWNLCQTDDLTISRTHPPAHVLFAV